MGDTDRPPGAALLPRGPTPASSDATHRPHLSFKTCQLVLGFASSKSLLLFLPPMEEMLGNFWEVDSRLWER